MSGDAVDPLQGGVEERRLEVVEAGPLDPVLHLGDEVLDGVERERGLHAGDLGVLFGLGAGGDGLLLAGDGLVARDPGFGLGLAGSLLLADGLVARGPGLVPLGDGLAPLPGDADHAGDRGDDERGREPGQRRLALRPHPEPHDRADRPGRDRLAAEPAVEVVGQRLGRGVAVPRVLLQALQADHFQVARQLRVQPGRGLRRAVADLVERVHHRVAGERRRPVSAA